MSRKLAAFLLIGFSLTAFNEVIADNNLDHYEYVGEDEGNYTRFYNFTNIKANDGWRYYWRLDDLYEPVGNGYLSVEYYEKIHCTLFKRSTLKILAYRKPMGSGDFEDVTPEYVKEERQFIPNKLTKKICETRIKR